MLPVYDHIVIGVGSMGSSACYHLSKRGASVLGLEQFGICHERGAHGGETRIIRKAYFEHPDYIPLLERAYENWREIELVSNEKIYHETGIFYAGPKQHALLEQIKESARLYQIPLKGLSNGDHHPYRDQFTLPADFEWMLEPFAGFLLTEKAIRSYVAAARKHNATIRENEKVLRWESNRDGVRVVTDKAEYQGKQLIFTAGPWSARLLNLPPEQLKITRQVLLWTRPLDPVPFSEQHFPCWLIVDHDKPGGYYGFPVHHWGSEQTAGGFKLAYHYPGDATDPEKVDRTIRTSDTDHLIDFQDRFLPGTKGQVLATKTCLYSNSQDEHFVIDRLKGDLDRVTVAWGFSGHGFKFVSVVGEILADLSMSGKTDLPIGFLNADRFKK